MKIIPKTEREQRAVRVADEQANEMRRKLEGGLTPAFIGWPGLTAEELIESEWRCWFSEEMNGHD
jgi:hypothetical protein